MNTTITLKLPKEKRLQLKNTWSEGLSDSAPEYSEYQLKLENCTITAYTSGTVVFQGKDAEVYAAAFSKPESNFVDHAGSDEVGTGDYFGPVCVVACVVRSSSAKHLMELGIRDSKQMSDEEMLKIAPILMKEVDYSLLILDNARYNRVHRGNNLNAIKARLHNQAYLNLKKKGVALPDLIVVDQFAPEASYYRYLKQEKEIVRGIHFETKAENKYLAVACASIIARYGFLKTWQALEEHYGMKLTKGASEKVDRDAAAFVKKYGFEELRNIAKLHFKNTDNVRNLIDFPF